MKQKNVLKFSTIVMILIVALSSCKKKEDSTPDTLKTSYTLKAKDLLGVTGTITIAEKSSGSTESVVTISLKGAPTGTHPAHIHMNSAIETGAIAYSLNSVDAAGESTTTLPVTYALLTNFDGYVNVHLDAATLNTIIGQCDIGGNTLTGTNHSYTLAQDSTTGISGSAKFEKRKNGNTLVTIDLTSGGWLQGWHRCGRSAISAAGS